jgi:putative ATP-dependent endonuclease of the OLD family
VATISKLVLKNFKRFRSLELDFDPELNILAGAMRPARALYCRR